MKNLVKDGQMSEKPLKTHNKRATLEHFSYKESPQ